MGRTLIVGDVHGCASELDDLIASVHFERGIDRLVLVGDLVARGPESRAVIERVMEYQGIFVRGNHDEKVVSWWRVERARGRREADKTVRLSERHRAVVDSLDERHFRRLAAAPLILALPGHGLTVVHAGVAPGSLPHECHEEVILTVRSLDADGKVSRKLLEVPWARAWRGPMQLVFGHDARRNLQVEDFATGLDTGCCYGRRLSALLLAEGEKLPADREVRKTVMTSVPAREVYCPMGSGEGPE
jgi:hypothetical protein